MIISRTPFRISFFGGGTDYPEWYNKNGGIVISTTINRYCYISLRNLPPYFDYKYNIRYSKREIVNRIEDIDHPSVKACFKKFLKSNQSVELVHHADIPDKSGIGSSSSFTVGLINCLSYFNNKILSKKELAFKAIDIEQNVIKETVGSQDQAIVSFGGFNKITFSKDKTFEVTPIPLTQKNQDMLNQSIVLLFTGFTRYSSKVSEEQKKKISENSEYLTKLTLVAEEAYKMLSDQKKFSIKEFGNFLDQNWQIKKKLSSNITNKDIDKLYEKGMKLGAYGGKLLGAGSGGFMCFIVDKDKKADFVKKFKQLYIPVKLDITGSQIVYYSQ
jgi:D-glycero-alpha-D-manno-heptose-7-phosphate kinase|tara:strand:- start:13140 stop:14129 length:990 start_codon:yes stop_codon:yes gene_type:complete